MPALEYGSALAGTFIGHRRGHQKSEHDVSRQRELMNPANGGKYCLLFPMYCVVVLKAEAKGYG
jgi:hypothetical protein